MIPNYERPVFLPQLKHEARVVSKVKRRRLKARMDAREKEAVRVRDKESCRVCGKRTRDVHERVFKSLGGLACLENSLCACRKCHEYAQGHAIKIIGKDCNHPLIFQTSAAVAHDIFRGRAVPKHVEVV